MSNTATPPGASSAYLQALEEMQGPGPEERERRRVLIAADEARLAKEEATDV